MGSYGGLRRPETVYFIKDLGGQDTAIKDLSLTNKGDIAQNCRFNEEIGSVTKRKALAYYNTTGEPLPIQSIYRYYRDSNSAAYLIQLNGTTLRVGNDSAGTFSTIATLAGSSGRRFTAVTYNDLAIISTGYDNIMQTDGTVAWELGACKAALTAGGTNLDASAAYYYAVTFSADATVNGAVSNTVTTGSAGGSRKVTLTNIPLGPAGTSNRKIYRTEGGGSALKLLTTLADNTTTTYVDDIADGSLTDAMPAVTDDMPRGKYLHVAQERLFVAGDPNFPNTIYHSDYYLPHWINSGSADLTTASATAASDYYDIVGSDDNDFIVGLKDFLGITFVFKQNSIRPYYVTGDSTTWTLGNILAAQGSPAPYSIVSTNYGIIYQGWDYFYLFNGNVSTPIIPEFLVKENILKTRIDETFGEFYQNMYMAAYTDSSLGHQYHDKVLVYDIVLKQLSIDKGGPRSTGSVNLNCFCSAKGITDEGQLYGGESDPTANRGFVYKYDRNLETVRYNTKTDLDTGTHTSTMVLSDESDPKLTRQTLDDMEYTTDALAQTAWASSVTTASKKAPPDLGTGVDGAHTVSAAAWATSTAYVVNDVVTQTSVNYVCLIAHTSGTFAADLADEYWEVTTADEIAAEDKNYTSLTIASGKVLSVADGVVIKVLGTATIAGTLRISTGSADLYAYTITVSGAVTGSAHLRSNTLNNTGTLKTNIADMSITTVAFENSGTAGGAQGTIAEAHDTDTATYYGWYYNHTPDGDWGASCYTYGTYTLSEATDIDELYYRMTAATMPGAGYPNGSCSWSLQVNYGSGWSTLYSGSGGTQSSIDSTLMTQTTGWAGVVGVRVLVNSAAGGDDPGYLFTRIHEFQANVYCDCDYVASTGTVPTSGSTTDFVYALDVFSEANIVNEGDYSLKVVVPPGANTLNGYLEKTITSIDLSATTHDTILVDVYALRSGTQFQLGIGESAGTDNLVNVPVTASNTWETVALDFSGVADGSKNAIIKLALKFTNTDSGNVVYVDNIRPALATATWTSPILEINAGSMGTIYWNEVLGTYGNVLVYTRNADTSANCSTATWSSATTGDYTSGALTNPAGSALKAFETDGSTVSTDPSDMKFFQFKIVLSATQTQTPDPDYSEFPYLYVNSMYLVQFDYYKTTSPAETSVEFIYRTGYRNFDKPLEDKIYKKIISIHEGTTGTFNLSYDIDNETGTSYTFGSISLSTYPWRWESFFPDSAFGRAIRFQWYKNDTEDFKIKQLASVIQTEPII